MIADPGLLAGFLVAALALNLTPGPDMLYTIGRSVAQGRAAGIAAALGVFAGCFVHIIAAALGLAALFELVPLAYLAVKYLGVAYLVFLGVRMIRDAGAAAAPRAAGRAPLLAIVRQGAVTNALNPKVALFFVAFLPQFVTRDVALGPGAQFGAGAQMLLLGLAFDVGGLLVNGAVALGFGAAGDWLQRRPGVWRLQHRFTGALFLALACRLAWPDRR